jgi:hypothetical protein
VYQEVFREFCVTVSKLEHELGESAEDDFWQELLREVKYYRFLLNAAPLPLNTYCDKLLPSIQGKLKICYNLFPNFVTSVQNLIDQLFILVGVCDNPFLEAIEKLIPRQEHRTTALLLKEAYLFPLVEDVLSSHPSLQFIELVNQRQLRGTDCYHQLFVIGPSKWHPAYIFRSPRAKEIHLIRYSWLIDRLPETSIFLKPFIQHKPTGSAIRMIEENRTIHDNNNLEEYTGYADEDILPEVNWQKISSKILAQIQGELDQEHVSAKMYILANEQAVFLETNENTKVLVLDLVPNEDDEDEEELQQIKRIDISKILPGMFLLLRTGGGGDYIISIANKILREQAPTLRNKQEHWKTCLRRAVEAKGILPICIELLDLGSELANEINVRNWMSNRSIHPQNARDFHAIIRLVGLQDKEQEYLDAARRIEQAHRQAGFYIRKQLLKQVEHVDFQELHRKGYMDFELPEAEGGSLTAFRIEHIAPGIFNMPASRVGHPTRVKDLLWPG